SFHYYAFHQDAGYWAELYLGQLRTAAQTYHTPVFFNELNCAEIYTGNTSGGAQLAQIQLGPVAGILVEGVVVEA
ncbi:hypothetical protein XarbCFBP8152_20955, partial [Xanthomonas arboricola]